MEHWDEVRTAYFVAREGTVSGAADALGVHHATVIRHIDALEQRLGVKLFQRHARGYTPTEAGEDLARVARATDDQMALLHGRLKGRGADVSGELVVTALPVMASQLMPVFASFQAAHPEIILRLMTGERLFRLEYGEAHVAIRAGTSQPDQPDNVVQRLLHLPVALCASRDYIARHGPVGDDLSAHYFVAPDDDQSRAPFYRWLFDTVPRERHVFRSDDMRAAQQAVINGIGIGFVNRPQADAHDLVEVIPMREEWAPVCWLLTHVDLHRTAKVQAFLDHIKREAPALLG